MLASSRQQNELWMIFIPLLLYGGRAFPTFTIPTLTCILMVSSLLTLIRSLSGSLPEGLMLLRLLTCRAQGG